MSVFADTSGLYAVLDRNDANHATVNAAWAHWLSNRQKLLTNNYVVLETVSLHLFRFPLPRAGIRDEAFWGQLMSRVR